MRSRPSPVKGIICTGKPSRSVKLQLQKSLAIDTRLDKLMWIESKQSSLPQVYGQQLRYPKKYLKLLTAVKLDKKISGGQVKFVLAKSIGRVDFGTEVPQAFIRASMK